MQNDCKFQIAKNSLEQVPIDLTHFSPMFHFYIPEKATNMQL